MKTVGIAELKARLSSYLELVQGGAEVLITDRGVPVARRAPLASGGKRGSRRQRLARLGLLRLGRGRMRRELTRPPRGEMAGGRVLAALLAERAEGR